MTKHLCADRNGLRNNVEEITKWKEAVFNSLQKELVQNPPLTPVGDVSACDFLVNKCTALRLILLLVQWLHLLAFFRELSTLHLKVLGNFRRNSSTPIEFPRLYAELFHRLN